MKEPQAGAVGLRSRVSNSAICVLLLVYALFTGCAGNDRIRVQRIQGADASGELVVLLHGMIRSSASLGEIADRLIAEGYITIKIDYPSRHRTVDEIIPDLHETLQQCCLAKAGRIHFVTHSMGGIVLRDYISKHRPPNLGRVVMLTPPNRGSELADWLGDSVLVGLVFGPATKELGTNRNSKPLSLPSVDFELGVIAGNRSWNPIASWLIPGPDDGTVSVERARIPGMRDFLVVPHTHTFIMNSNDVINEVVYFLSHGFFSKRGNPAVSPYYPTSGGFRVH